MNKPFKTLSTAALAAVFASSALVPVASAEVAPAQAASLSKIIVEYNGQNVALTVSDYSDLLDAGKINPATVKYVELSTGDKYTLDAYSEALDAFSNVEDTAEYLAEKGTPSEVKDVKDGTIKDGEIQVEDETPSVETIAVESVKAINNAGVTVTFEKLPQAINGATIEVTDPTGKTVEVVAQNIAEGATSATFPFAVAGDLTPGTWTVEGKTFVVKSSDAKLGSLTTDTGIWSADFKSAIKSYTVNVTSDTNELKLTPQAAEGAVIQLTVKDTNASGTAVAGNPVILTNGVENTVKLSSTSGVTTTYVEVKVIAPDNSSVETYDLSVVKAAANATDDAFLTALTAATKKADGTSGVANFIPTSFDKTKTAYTAVVPNDSTKLELTATQANATLYVNGEKYTSASTKSIDLVVGKNTVEIKVVAPDNKTEKVYTIEVTRASENASAVNTLNSLTLSEGTLGGGFKADTNDNASSLTASVKNATQEIVITPVATNSKALVDVTVASGSGLKVEKIGSAYKITGLKEKGAPTPVTNDITISVKPENGGAAQDYVLKVTRANATASDLASLTGFTGLTQITDFASTKTDYAFNVTNGTGTIAITPAGAPSGSTVTVNGKVTSGTENVDLKVGENVITVKVTAENQINSRTYTIKVNRASASASSVDTLSGLTVNGATLNETFAEATTAYTTTVLNSVQDLTITPTAKDSKAVVTVKAIKGTTGTNKLEVVQSGSSYTIKGLAEGDNTVTISVQPENAGTAKDYTLTVTRVAATASDSALLSGIALNAGGAITLTNWNNTVESYTVPTKVANATNTITVTPTVATGAKAEVTVNGNKVNASGTGVLNVGENTIVVKVTAPNGVATKTYTFKVTRQGETLGKEAGVTLASDKGTLTHNALATVTSGAVTADGSLVLTNDVSSLNFTATPADAQAAVVVTYDADGTGSTPVTLTKNAQGTYTIANVAEGKGELKVTVTSEDTNVSNTVTIEVDKAKTGATGLASVAAISLDNGATEIKNFDPETTSYTVPVAHLPGTVTPLVSKGHADQTVTYKLNGKVITSATDLLVGDNTLVVTVVSPDKKVTKEYTVVIKRVSGNLSALAGLSVNGTEVSDPTMAVAASLAADVSDYKFTAVASPKATVKVTAKNTAGQTIIVSPGANNEYTASALTEGKNVITVQVTAEDGVTVKTYTIEVTKAGE